MSDNVKPWPKPAGRPEPLPRRILRPCDYGLRLAVDNAEIQLGTIEAYNRLVAEAQRLHAQIEAGNAKPQNPLFAADTGAVR